VRVRSGVTARRVLVVDDEPLARARLVRFLGSAGSFEVREAADGLAALEVIRAFAPDLVFLDVEMPELSGLELLAQLPERRFRVIFQTAYDAYAVAAFEAEACDYLVKPFTEQRFRAALARSLARASDEERLRALERRLAGREGALARVAVRIGARVALVPAADVAAFVSRDHVTCVHLVDGREGSTDLSLDALEERLDGGAFRRLHRASLVNTRAVTEVGPAPDGGARVTLRGGLALPVSRRRARAARELVRTLA